MIRISRKSMSFDSFRRYKIYVDDKFCCSINDGEIKEINIDEGEHSIYLKIDWCKSNKLNFSIKDNQVLNFNCGNSMNGLKCLLFLIYVTFLKNSYLFIEYDNNIE